MSRAPVTPPEVVRGMRFDAMPLRLARASLSEPPVQAGCATPATSANDEGLRLGMEQGLREGRERGLREGREEGLREGRAQAEHDVRTAVEQAVAAAVAPLAQEQSRLQTLSAALTEAVDDALACAHDEIVALCFETVCRILGEAAVRPEVVPHHLAYLRGLHKGREVVLHVHPDDADLLARTLDGAGSQPALRWAADQEVALGGCIVRCPDGGLDARLETMLLACKEALLEARRAGAPSVDVPGRQA